MFEDEEKDEEEAIESEGAAPRSSRIPDSQPGKNARSTRCATSLTAVGAGTASEAEP